MLRLAWERPTRVLMHLTDAPCHGTEFGGMGDSRPGDGPRMKPLLQQLQQKGVDYYFGTITSRTDTMVRELNRQMGVEFIKEVRVGGTGTGLAASFRAAVSKAVRESVGMGRAVASRSLAPIPGSGGPGHYLGFAPAPALFGSAVALAASVAPSAVSKAWPGVEIWGSLVKSKARHLKNKAPL